ncbi:MAG: hypothetical protein ICV51_14885 [Flavisolibacter sp.]|nr:hypothetical protein [Flavisolibacter sp.]
MNQCKRIFTSGLVTTVLLVCSSWGFLVHRTINQLAIYQLPKAMQPFFLRNETYLVQQAVRPDLRRNEDPTEAPKHFIDLEPFGDSAAWKMSHTWSEAIAKYSKDTLIKYGYVPYWIIEMKSKLTNAFRSSNRDSILFYAADLGHYIGDANVPLHTSVNYDGQLTGQRGLHSLWESMVPELNMNQYQLYNKRRTRYLTHPEEAVWNAIRSAHLLVQNVVQQEQEASKTFKDSTKYRVQLRNGREVRSYTTSFAKAYSEKLGNTVNQQLLHSANLIADIWYTSWVDAGRPNLNHLLDKQPTKEEKRKWKEELHAYRSNQLIQKNLLLARQEKPEE